MLYEHLLIQGVYSPKFFLAVSEVLTAVQRRCLLGWTQGYVAQWVVSDGMKDRNTFIVGESMPTSSCLDCLYLRLKPLRCFETSGFTNPNTYGPSKFAFSVSFIHVKEDFNLLIPTGYVMHEQFNIQQLYVLPTLYLCVLYLSENKQRLVPLTA